MKLPILLLPLTANNISEVLQISNDLFGDNYMKLAEIEEYLTHPNKTCLIAQVNGVVVGFQLMQVLNVEGLLNLALKDKEWFANRYNQKCPIGVLKSVAVSESAKKQGVATKLTVKSLELLKENSTHVISILWHQNGVMPIASILERCGMKSVNKIDAFWSLDSLDKGYACKICGTPPCQCNAYVFEC